MTRVYEDEHVAIEMFGPLGPYQNNAYIVRPNDGGPIVIVDAPAASEEVVLAAGHAEVSHIIVTHSHFDHWAGFDVLRAHTAAPVYASGEETNLEPSRNVEPLADGAEVPVGGTALRVIHTPGHTPGSICLLVGGALFTGDTLFPGGPGHSRSPEDLLQEIGSITSRLLVLPDETLVLPGHGATTTIAVSKQEYAIFAAKEREPGLYGDVLWTQS